MCFWWTICQEFLIILQTQNIKSTSADKLSWITSKNIKTNKYDSNNITSTWNECAYAFMFLKLCECFMKRFIISRSSQCFNETFHGLTSLVTVKYSKSSFKIRCWQRYCLHNLTPFRFSAYIQTIKYFGQVVCEKGNASTPLGIEPRTFRLPVECSIIWATEVPHNFSQRIYIRLMRLRIHLELFTNFSKSFQSIMSIIRRVYYSQW